MNIKKFMEKYKVIVILVAMIIVLAFVKSYFGKKINNNDDVKTVETSQITKIPNETNNSAPKITKTQTTSDTDNTLGNLNKKDDSQNNGRIISNQETDKKYNELVEKNRTFQTEEEYSEWFESLSFMDQELLLGDKPLQLSQLSDDLPYEGTTFVVKAVISNSVVQVKSKIDDLEKAGADVRDWLSTKAMNFSDLVISWE